VALGTLKTLKASFSLLLTTQKKHQSGPH